MPTKKIKFSTPYKIAFIYFAISGVYIIFSDQFLEKAFSPDIITEFQSFKGLIFVFLSSLLIYILVKKNLGKINQSKLKYRLLADHSKDLICLHKPDSEIVYLSPSVKELLGYDLEEMIGKKTYDYIHHDDIKKVEKNFCEIVSNGKKIENPIKFRIKKKTDEYIWVEAAKQPIIKNNKVIGIVSSSRDITERVEANKSIKNYQKSLQNLTYAIFLVEEQQRKKIASNIHDHLSQSLVISKMKLQDLKEQKPLENYQTDINLIVSYITDAIENSRKITYDLCPPVLYELGIVDTMYWLADKTEEQHNVQVEFTTNTENIKLDDNELISIYRSIQELVTNAIKHAKASLIKIDFKLVDNGLNILVSDNGIGFDVEKTLKTKVLNSGFGLFTLKERIHNLKGTVNIISKPSFESGTIIDIFIYL